MNTDILNKALAYLGKRFDALEVLLRKGEKNEIKIDLGESSEILSGVATELNRVTALLMAQAESKGDSDKANLDNNTELKRIAHLMESQAESLLSISQNKDAENMFNVVKVTMSAIVDAIREIEIKAPEVKIEGLSDLAKGIDRIIKSLESLSLKALEGKVDRTNILLEKLIGIIPKSVKIDGDQFRELVGTLKGGAGSSGGGSVGGGSLGMSPTDVVGIGQGRKDIAVTGTAIALSATSRKVRTVFVTSYTTNSDLVVLGGSGVIYTEATRTGKVLYAGDSITIEIDDLSKLFINGTAGDGVTFTYTK